MAEPVSLAILDLQARNGLSQDSAGLLTDRLRAYFLSLGDYQILERSRVQALLGEQGFQQGHLDCEALDCAQLGRLLAVKQLVIGSAGRIGNTYTLNARLIDVENGRILKEAYADCQNCSLDEVLQRTTLELGQKLLGHTPAAKRQRDWGFGLGIGYGTDLDWSGKALVDYRLPILDRQLGLELEATYYQQQRFLPAIQPGFPDAYFLSSSLLLHGKYFFFPESGFRPFLKAGAGLFIQPPQPIFQLGLGFQFEPDALLVIEASVDYMTGPFQTYPDRLGSPTSVAANLRLMVMP
ncbi:MAG: CsgG/HfaB family protein [Candidatus Sericytochromatia bacterium]